jgi:PAS domain S-box-containing protein
MTDQERRDTAEQEAIRAIVEGTATHTGERFFRELVRHVASALDVHGAWVTELIEDRGLLRSYAFWLDGGWVEEYEYAIAGTPCEPVISDNCLVLVPDRVIELFPGDPDLAEIGAVSYMGVPLHDTDGSILGHLAVLDTRPMPEHERFTDLFRIFANRAAAELRRLRAEAQVLEREKKLSRLVDSAMDAIVELDHELRITRVNPAAEKVFAGDSKSLYGQRFDGLLRGDGPARLAESVRDLDALPEGQRYLWIAGGLPAARADGEEFPAEASLSRFEVRDRGFYTLILRNVDDRRQAEHRIRSLEQETEDLRRELRVLGKYERILGNSKALLAVLREIDQVAETGATVLIQGETGTGKELIAAAIHDASPRSRRPMIKVNCAAIPVNLMESELFGHERGAFTGATRRRDGRFALADHGTIFLDEVGELPQDLQAKLLRVLQEGEFEPVGSAKTQKVDVRAIAATNRDLEASVKRGEFREDLFYRLNVFPIVVPPLRERGEDVVVLADTFLRKFARGLGREIDPLDEAAKLRLRAYDWPGNVRELRNVVERAVITSREGRVDLDRALPVARPDAVPEAVVEDRVRTESEMRALERANIERALESCGGKVSGTDGAAQLLGMRPSTLSSRIKALGIRRSDSPS